MSLSDTKLRLLSGMPLYVDEKIGNVTPFTIREIVNYGYINFFHRLNLFAIEEDEIVPASEKGKLNVFDILTEFGGKESISELEKSLSFFLRDKMVYVEEYGIITNFSKENTIIVQRDNYDSLKDIILIQNMLKEVEEKRVENQVSDKAKEILAKLNRSKEIISKVKSVDESGEKSDFSDMISAVASKSNSLNINTVFDLTLYQFYDSFKRLELIDQYRTNIDAMLAGSKNIKLKHWSTSID